MIEEENMRKEDIAKAIRDMISLTMQDSGRPTEDISHFMKVWGFARTIGISEHLDEHTQYILELAAVVHDIACPLCRRKYGNTCGIYQEREGIPMAKEFYSGYGLDETDLERICFLVGHHHTYRNVNGLDWQILLEADFLVNAGESEKYRRNVQKFRENVFQTETGIQLLAEMYL